MPNAGSGAKFMDEPRITLLPRPRYHYFYLKRLSFFSSEKAKMKKKRKMTRRKKMKMKTKKIMMKVGSELKSTWNNKNCSRK